MSQAPKVLVRNSERTSYTTCRFRWDLAFNNGLQSRDPAKALWFGDLIHQALARYYKKGSKRGPLPAKTFLRLYDSNERLSAVQRNDEGEWESMRDLGRGMLLAYVEEFQARDEEWEVISSEQTFQVRIPDTPIWVVGTFDGVWRNLVKKKRIAFKEFKTASAINLDNLNLDEQASMYWTYGPRWLWKKGLLPKGTYPSEILYTFLRKAIRNPEYDYDDQGRKLNKDGSVSKSQPAPFFERQPIYRDKADRRNAHERLMAQVDEMGRVRDGELVAYKVPGPLHNPNCRGCPFRGPCELHETGGDWESMLQATTEPWDPYSAHEIVERR